MNQLNTILDWIRFAITAFSKPENDSRLTYGQGCMNPFDEAHALVLGLLNLPFDLDKDYFGAKLTNDEIKLVKKGIEQRIEQQLPTAYITHRAPFMDLEFYVDSRVLIPRSPIAELLRQQFEPYLKQTPETILDLCCGSGCIGIASSYVFPEAQVMISDIDEGAIEVANMNIDKHDIGGNVTAIQSNLFDSLDGYKFDLIISNPPYVDQDTMDYLPIEFKHEPSLALESGSQGLDITLKIFKLVKHYLNPNGLFVLEVGDSYDLLEEVFPEFEFNWHVFEMGGLGVMVMDYPSLKKISSLI